VPEYRVLQHAAQGGDWRTIAAFFHHAGYAPLHDSGAWIVVETAGIERLLSAVLAAQPEDLLPRVLMGGRLIKMGWEIRTSKRAQHVSREQFQALHDHLRKAEGLLMDVTARQPDNVLAWYFRLTTARGLELGHAEARRRYDQIARRDPHRLGPQAQLQQQLCPKWGGSWAKMHGFTRECMQAAPPGSANAWLVVDGHIEHGLEDGDLGAYLRQPEVHAEVYEAANRSVLHPSWRPGTPGWVAAHSTFAMAFSILGDMPAAATQFRALGDFACESPWEYLGDPAIEFRRYRAAALAGAAR
jgi:hypothetical protein